MLDADVVYETGRFSYADAEYVADQWNAAYPVMRIGILTSYIESYRKHIKDMDQGAAPLHSKDAHLRRLRHAEELRLKVGQLDRATYKGCTRSPGGFSVIGGYMVVRQVIQLSSIGTEDMALVYRLAATLAEAQQAVDAERAARDLREPISPAE